MSNDIMRIRQEELVTNPSNRVPVVLCLDASGSMSGEPMAELNKGIQLFIEAVRQDPIACSGVEMSVVSFSSVPRVEFDFQAVENAQSFEIAATGGATDLGGGVILALDVLERRKAEYQRAGIDYFQPWLVLLTDGQPTTDAHIAAGSRARELERLGKLVVFPIAIGSGAELTTLGSFSEKRQPLRLKGLNFREFFRWLSKSVARVSQSRPGEKILLDLDGIKGWGEI